MGGGKWKYIYSCKGLTLYMYWYIIEADCGKLKMNFINSRTTS